ncbi:MAG: ABC transporter ATP-binding protein [Candidatus Levybacteria bacterium]|nr:ABC transporter ATP-binding protein [Candidatus Levybacteria bacterium]
MQKRIIAINIEKKFMISGRKPKSALESFVSLVWGKEHKRTLQVLKDVSFSVGPGEIVGIVGRNGSGKSTLLRIIAGIYESDRGTLQMEGKVIALLNLNLGFQERLTMKENIHFCLTLFGLSKKQAESKYDGVVAFSGLGKFQNTKIFQFSRGMKERLAFSIACHADGDIFLLDEAFSVGDEGFQKKTAEAVLNLRKKGCSIVIVAHDLNWLKKNTKRTLWLEKGKIVADGPSKVVIQKYSKYF